MNTSSGPSRLRRTLALMLLGIATVAASGCDYFPPSPVGIEQSADGRSLIVHIDRCDPDELVERVAIFRPNDAASEDIDRKADEVEWEIRSGGEPFLAEFTTGETPPFFELVVEAPETFPRGRLRAYVESYDPEDERTRRLWEEFRLDDLQPGMVYSDYRLMSREAFHAQDPCYRDPGPDFDTGAWRAAGLTFLSVMGIWTLTSFGIMGVMLTKEFRRIRRSR